MVSNIKVKEAKLIIISNDKNTTIEGIGCYNIVNFTNERKRIKKNKYFRKWRNNRITYIVFFKNMFYRNWFK